MPTQTQNLTEEESLEVDDLPDLLSETEVGIVDAAPLSEAAQTQQILTSLLDPHASPKKKCQWILDLEGTSFDKSQAGMLEPVLFEFIQSQRNSSDPLDAIAVGSAIRQYVAILDGTELGSIATLLEAEHRTPVSLEIELEIAKMVVRKLTAVPSSSANPFPELADRLMEICRTYLNARLLPRTNYGATALNAILGLTLLAASHLPELFEQLRNLRVVWFKQQIARRTNRLLSEPALQEADKAEWPCGKSLHELAASVTEEAG